MHNREMATNSTPEPRTSLLVYFLVVCLFVWRLLLTIYIHYSNTGPGSFSLHLDTVVVPLMIPQWCNVTISVTAGKIQNLNICPNSYWQRCWLNKNWIVLLYIKFISFVSLSTILDSHNSHDSHDKISIIYIWIRLILFHN